MSLSGLIQFILGFVVGVLILTGAGAATAYFFFNRLSENPPMPAYEEEQESEESSPPEEEESEPEPEPEPEPEEPEEPEESESIQDRFGEEAFEARVTWPDGLSLRDSPSEGASRIGGVQYDERLIVIERSGDWQRVHVPENGQEAWVKAGNVEEIN
ncbi:MAG: SH3 domain-containing protein [Halothece sp.]